MKITDRLDPQYFTFISYSDTFNLARFSVHLDLTSTFLS